MTRPAAPLARGRFTALAAAHRDPLAASARRAAALAARGRLAGALVALAAALAACGASHDPADMPPAPGPAQPAPKDLPEPTCAGVADPLGDLDWIPRDVTLAAAIDLADPGHGAAAERLARAAGEIDGLPIVAALGLGQLDVQLSIVQGLLRSAGLAPRELVLLHEPGGAVAWVFRVRCDLGALQAIMTRAWGLRSRTTATGPIAEPGARPFAHDAVFLADDRVMLAPAGRGGALRRWLEAPAEPALAAGRGGPTPGDALAGLAPAPIRVVLAGRGLLTGGAAAGPRTLQAWPDRVALSP